MRSWYRFITLGLLACGGPQSRSGSDLDSPPSAAAPLEPAMPATWYLDADGDGYGSDADTAVRQEQPPGWVAVGGDCDDGNPVTHPGAHDWCGDDMDEDCSGSARSCGELTGDDADLMLIADEPADRLGYGVSPAGDQNGDGYDDIIVGAPWTTDSYGGETGAIYLFPGSADGVDPDGLGTGAATASITGGGGEMVGWGLGWAGDVNADGVDDIMVGWGTYGSMNVSVFYGPVVGDIALTDANAQLSGWSNSVNHHPGHAAGDVNGDGFDDLVVTNWQVESSLGEKGTTYVVHGPVTGQFDLATEAVVLAATDGNERAAWDAVGIGDSDGDGISDVATSSYRSDHGVEGAGAAYIFNGPITTSTTLNLADALFTGEEESDYAGTALAAPGDVNGDGLADLLVGAILQGFGEFRGGAAYLVLGPFDGVTSLEHADCILIGQADRAHMGDWLAPAGDWNGDGRADILIGNGGYTDSTHEAQASVVLAPAEGIRPIEDADYTVQFTDDPADGSVIGTGAGDVNGDGFGELLMGYASVADAEEPWGAAYLYYGHGGR
jgi:hypothetical protein